MKKITFIISLFLCLSMAQAQTNLMAGYNGDFENDLTSWRFFEVPSSVGSTVVITSDAISGTKAVKVTYLDGAGVADRGFDNWDAHPPVIGGRMYNLKAFLKSDQASGLVTNVTLGFFNGAGTFVGQESMIVNLTTTYNEFLLTTIAPPSATYCFISFRTTDASGNRVAGSMYVDNVRLYEVVNGDFETGDLGGWDFYVRSADSGLADQCTASISTDSHSGSSAAQVAWASLNPATDDEMFSQNLRVVPGQRPTYKAWAKSLSGTFMARLHCSYFGINGEVLGDYGDDTWILTGNYTEHTWILPVVPNGTVNTNIGFRAFGWDGTNASRFPATTVSCLIDDVQLIEEPLVFSADLLSGINGGFELGNTDHWRYIKIDNGGYANLTATMSASSHSGAYAAQIDWPGAYSGLVESLFDQYPAAVPGQNLVYKAWAKTLGDPIMLRMHCTFFDAGNAVLGDHNDQTWILTGDYTEHTWVVPTVPAGTATTNIGFRAFNADGGRWPATSVSCLIDDVRLLDTAPPVATGVATANTVKCSIYPNPASGMINIMSDKAIKLACIYNMAGQKVKEMNSSFTSINIGDLHSGIYFVKMLTTDGESTQKLVVK